MGEDKNTGFRLPERLITMVDLNRTLRELKYLDDWLKQAAIRAGGTEVKAPKTSATLDSVASLNKVSLLDETQRSQLIKLLEGFKESAPKIHMSFAVEPSAFFLNKMVVWLRANINPIILIEVGLQPALAAGCSVRTQNKLFDMSLKNRFVDSRKFLIQSIVEISGNQTAPAITAETQVAEPVAAEPVQETQAPNVAPEPEVAAAPAPAPTDHSHESVQNTEVVSVVAEAPNDQVNVEVKS